MSPPAAGYIFKCSLEPFFLPPAARDCAYDGLMGKIAGDRKKDSVLWLAPLPLKEAKKAVEDQQRQPEGVSEGRQATDPQEACKARRHRSREPDWRVSVLVFGHEPLDQSGHFNVSGKSSK